MGMHIQDEDHGTRKLGLTAWPKHGPLMRHDLLRDAINRKIKENISQEESEKH
jgi:hypothetical protein